MILRLKVALLFVLALGASAFAGQAHMVSLGRVAQAKDSVRIYSRPSTRSHVYYSVHPNEYLVVRNYKKASPYLLVLMSNGRFGYALADSMNVLNYEYKVPETPQMVALSTAPRPTALSSRSGADLRAAVAQYSLNFKGTPYVWGGNDLKGGVDCSGFVKQLYGQIGLNLPRTAAEQVNVGIPINRLEDLRPGDRLYFWDSNRGMIGHTGIYLGDGKFEHSSRTHRGVDTDDLHNPKWMRILYAARR